MRAAAAAAGAVALLAACSSPAAPIPSPPAGYRSVAAPPDLTLADSAVSDVLSELKRRALPRELREHDYIAPPGATAEQVRAWYGARLAGWRVVDFPTRTRLARTAVWRSGGQVFAALLMDHADASSPSGAPVKLLITLEPAAR